MGFRVEYWCLEEQLALWEMVSARVVMQNGPANKMSQQISSSICLHPPMFSLRLRLKSISPLSPKARMCVYSWLNATGQ